MTDAELAALEQRLGETKFHADWALAFKELFAAVRRVNAAEQTLEQRLKTVESIDKDIAALHDRIVHLERGTILVPGPGRPPEGS